MDTYLNAGKAIYGQDLLHGLTVCVVKSFGQCLDGVWLEVVGRVLGANAQNGQTKLPKAIG